MNHMVKATDQDKPKARRRVRGPKTQARMIAARLESMMEPWMTLVGALVRRLLDGTLISDLAVVCRSHASLRLSPPMARGRHRAQWARRASLVEPQVGPSVSQSIDDPC